MLNKALASMLLVGIIFSLPATAEDSLVRFEGAIAVIPAAPTTPVNDPNIPNIQCQYRNCALGSIPPTRYPFVIKGLSVDVKLDGRISVVGRGLLNAGGANIGTNKSLGATISVFASLHCSDGSAGFDEYRSNDGSNQGVPVDLNGDFIIDGVLTGIPPAPCVDARFLLREGNRVFDDPPRWYAAGIPKR